MINNIFISDNAPASDLDRDFKDAHAPASAPESSCSPLLLTLRLRKKHINIAPKVIMKRNTINNKVVPLVLPSCINEKQNQILQYVQHFKSKTQTC